MYIVSYDLQDFLRPLTRIPAHMCTCVYTQRHTHARADVCAHAYVYNHICSCVFLDASAMLFKRPSDLRPHFALQCKYIIANHKFAKTISANQLLPIIVQIKCCQLLAQTNYGNY